MFKKLLNEKNASSGTQTCGLQPAPPMNSCCAAKPTLQCVHNWT